MKESQGQKRWLNGKFSCVVNQFFVLRKTSLWCYQCLECPTKKMKKIPPLRKTEWGNFPSKNRMGEFPHWVGKKTTAYEVQEVVYLCLKTCERWHLHPASRVLFVRYSVRVKGASLLALSVKYTVACLLSLVSPEDHMELSGGDNS